MSTIKVKCYDLFKYREVRRITKRFPTGQIKDTVSTGKYISTELLSKIIKSNNEVRLELAEFITDEGEFVVCSVSTHVYEGKTEVELELWEE